MLSHKKSARNLFQVCIVFKVSIENDSFILELSISILCNVIVEIMENMDFFKNICLKENDNMGVEKILQ